MSRNIHVTGLVLTFISNRPTFEEVEEEAREIVRRVELDLKSHAGEMGENLPLPSMSTTDMWVDPGAPLCDICQAEGGVEWRLDPLAALDGAEEYLDMCDSCLAARLREADPQDWAYPSDDYNEYPAYHDCDPANPQIQQFTEDDLTVQEYQGNSDNFKLFDWPRSMYLGTFTGFKED